MNLNHLSDDWSTVAPAIGNHLWQSTLFVAAAGLLTLFLHKNHAQARYWLWLAASVKFLIPFSLLVSAGQHLAWSHRATGTNGEIYFSLERLSQPFSQPPAAASSTSTPAMFLSNLNHLTPVLIVAVWFCGFAAVLFTWATRWRRISDSIRQVAPLEKGREIESLRQVERAAGVRRQIPLLVSDNSLEPGIFGITRPVLVWPRGISDRLEDAHLKSILAHELCHVRRRDNLAAAIHMAVEAIFWFHPLVWWVGHRLVEERELACDEAVLEMGSARQVYAESILKICEFCVASPLNCVSGVTGADLKKRIAHIMTEDLVHKLNFRKKLLLGAAGLAAVAAPLAFGLLNTTQTLAQSKSPSSSSLATASTLDTASITLNKEGTEALTTGGVVQQLMTSKPGEFIAKNASLRDLLRVAFRVADYQFSGIPKEFDGQLYDVEASANKSVLDGAQEPDNAHLELLSRQMVEALLEKKLHLRFHRETKEMPAYFLVVAERRKLHKTQGDCPAASSVGFPKPGPGTLPPAPCGIMRLSAVGQLEGRKVTMSGLAAYLANITSRAVTDKTNLTGEYDITLKWAPNPPLYPEYTGPRDKLDPKALPLLAALQEQVGLKLEPQTAPVEIVVIDHIEMPSGN